MEITIHKLEFVLVLISVVALEIIFANYLPLALHFDLYLVFALYIGWYSTPVKGALSGVTLGLIQDAITGIYLGLNGLSKTVLGFAGAYLGRRVTFESFLSRVILIGMLSLIDRVLILVMLLLLNQPLVEGFWMNALIKATVTGVLGGVIFSIYDRLKHPRKDFRRLQV
ncbi:MAG: rod shape-determining protein MreD [Acidobacteriota bacterium]